MSEYDGAEQSALLNDGAEPAAPLSGVERDRQILTGARRKGRFATMRAFMKLSGPGWLQSAITLGGGSLASSLYLGVLGGFALLWLQPMAMILGIIMLNSRRPRERLGDLKAQIASTFVGRQRIEQLYEKYGRAQMTACAP